MLRRHYASLAFWSIARAERTRLEWEMDEQQELAITGEDSEVQALGAMIDRAVRSDLEEKAA